MSLSTPLGVASVDQRLQIRTKFSPKSQKIYIMAEGLPTFTTSKLIDSFYEALMKFWGPPHPWFRWSSNNRGQGTIYRTCFSRVIGNLMMNWRLEHQEIRRRFVRLAWNIHMVKIKFAKNALSEQQVGSVHTHAHIYIHIHTHTPRQQPNGAHLRGWGDGRWKGLTWIGGPLNFRS